jgi:hypothetical protein
MITHPPADGVSPQPVRYNDHIINKLRLEIQSVLPFEINDPQFDESAPRRCDQCTKSFNSNDGYLHRGDFYCHDCLDELAQKGEFC